MVEVVVDTGIVIIVVGLPVEAVVEEVDVNKMEEVEVDTMVVSSGTFCRL
jgi:hypothetical protein